MTTIGTLIAEPRCYRGFLTTRTVAACVVLVPARDDAGVYHVHAAAGIVGTADPAPSDDGVPRFWLRLGRVGTQETLRVRLVARHGALALEVG